LSSSAWALAGCGSAPLSPPRQRISARGAAHPRYRTGAGGAPAAGAAPVPQVRTKIQLIWVLPEEDWQIPSVSHSRRNANLDNSRS
jgi:hypothetical protein